MVEKMAENLTQNQTQNQVQKQKVAVYIRVSNSSSQMLHSLKMQEEYYQAMIRENKDWECAGVYADAGISGMNIEKRAGFQRMIQDCKNGKIDKILVKSVSRFARNTVDLLRVVRMLKTWEISVWFEEQKLDSLTEEGELMLTLIASVAQAESEAVSENTKWAVRKGFEKGIGNTRHRTFGYQWIDKKMVIVPEEAEAVKRIFKEYLSGSSYMKISRELNQDGITSIHGNPISVSAVRTILRNVTYTGNLLLQKTFVKEPISKKKVINTGQLPQYFVWNTHEAVIDMETFQKVQKKLADNKKLGRFPYNRTGKTYPFTKKIICGCCGRHYTRQVWNSGKNGIRRATWVCTGKKAEKYRQCRAKNISEEKLMEISTKMLGLEKFEEEIFLQKIKSITVFGKNELVFERR